jgi:hypothetical protein
LDFHVFYKITESKGNVKTYVATQTRIYSDCNREELTYLIQVGKDGDYLGRSELRFNAESKEDYFRNKPFEEYTETGEGLERQKLAIRRILIMNAYTQIRYDLPLHSSTHFILYDRLTGEPVMPQKKVWERLVVFGYADRYKQTNHLGDKLDRFVFTNDPAKLHDTHTLTGS